MGVLSKFNKRTCSFSVKVCKQMLSLVPFRSSDDTMVAGSQAEGSPSTDSEPG